MVRIHLDDASHEQLRSLRRKPLMPKVRERIEMLILGDVGWSAPQIASHLGYCDQTVRDMLEDFLDRGTQAIQPQRTGPAPDLGRRN